MSPVLSTPSASEAKRLGFGFDEGDVKFPDIGPGGPRSNSLDGPSG
jgi:hypothetical protein